MVKKKKSGGVNRRKIATANDKTARQQEGGYNNSISNNNNNNSIDRKESEDCIKILGSISPMSELREMTSYDDNSDSYHDDDEKKESELTNNEVSGRFRSARGSGWIGSSTSSSAFSKSNTPHRRNHNSTAQDVLQKLQQEVAVGPSFRKPSPMARMRDTRVQEAVSTGIRYKFVTKQKTDDQVKKEKQRKWKEKMKIAQQRKRQEQKALDGDGSHTTTKGAGGNDQYSNALLSCVLDNVEQTKLFKQFTQCGEDPVEDEEDSMYEAWSAGESSVATSDEDESAAQSEGKPEQRGRQKERGLNPRPRLPSESSGHYSTDTSADSSAQEESPPDSVDKDENQKGKMPVKKDNKEVIQQVTSKKEVISGMDKNVPVVAAQEKVVPIVMETKMDQTQEKRNVFQPSSVQPAHRASQSRYSASTISTLQAKPKKERNFVNDFIEDLTDMGESMLWHKETAVMNPATVRIRLKKGYRCMDGTFCSPRLVWADDSKGQKYGVDLFDIQSLTKADTLELENFPYAMPGRTVCLKIANGGSFILEARSEEDAFRFVRGIRWVVSRLAFNLVIGNVDVSCELLDLGLIESPAVARPSSLMEFDWSRAMDDVADHLVEKTLAAAMI